MSPITPCAVSRSGKYWVTDVGYAEKNGYFAYKVFEDGIIVKDMSHAKLLTE